MKRFTSLVAASLVLAIGLSKGQAQNTVYFDVNGTSPDSGAVSQAYNWTTDGSGLAPAFWNLDSGGVGSGTATWVNGDNAIFSAGSDADGLLYGINVAAGSTALSVLIKNGTLQVTGGLVDTGAGNTTVGNGTGSNEAIQIAAVGQLNAAGKLVLDGGTLIHTNSGGTGGSLIPGAKSLEVTANGGTISYQSTFIGATPNFSTPSIIYVPIAGAVLGTGGTTANGGANTLTIDNTANSEVRFQNAGTANSTYAKLVVKNGMFRFGNVSGQNFETAAGAVPLAPLADAITVDGGFLGASWAVVLNANRGLTVGPNGGGFDNGGGQLNPSAGAGTIAVSGPFSGSGTFTVKGISNVSANRQGGITLSNANNVTSFTGGLNIQGATLTLNESLNATFLMGDHTLTTPPVGVVPTTPCGLITIAAGKTLTFGSDSTSTSYDGQVSGSGSITKVGTGTLTMNSFGGEWTNSGGTNINDGELKYTTAAAGVTGPVTIAATGKLNMNGINDTFASLAGPAGAIVDMKDTAATAGNLTLNAASPVNTTYSGTIVGGGNLTKSSSSTQVLAGNTSLGTVAVNGGTLLNNATMTTSGGVTVAATATLGGTGSIIGAIGNSGIIAPGASVGTLSVTGNVTDLASSHWAIELFGATADKLAVTGNIDLSGTDFLDITATSPTGTSWLIGSYTGTETGVFDTITSGYNVTYTGGNITLNAVPACAPGDLNCDTHVDAGDYVFWRKNGSVPAGDYNIWRANFGVPAGAGSGGGLSGGAVPEPTTIGLVLVGLAAFGMGRRKRSA